MKFDAIDGCPVPREIADEVREVKRRSGARLNSCYRGSDSDAARILKQFGKMTQEYLWRAYWVLRLPWARPANRPRQSTHECYSDAVAYPGPVGRRLKGWQVGMDWEIAKVPAVIRAFAQIGWVAVRTYPNSALEAQHVNVRKPGRQFVPFLVVKRGSKRTGRSGRRIGWVRYVLNMVHDPDTRKPYLNDKGLSKKQRRTFGGNLDHAVRKFQRDYDQKADGIVGRQTYEQLKVCLRRRKHKNQQTRRKRRG